MREKNNGYGKYVYFARASLGKMGNQTGDIQYFNRYCRLNCLGMAASRLVKMRHLEALIGFSGALWTARLDGHRFEAPEWDLLQEQLIRHCRQTCPGQSLRIGLRFDMRQIPRWFHQYQTHYFNEIIEINT